jgi:hypothetical protein
LVAVEDARRKILTGMEIVPDIVEAGASVWASSDSGTDPVDEYNLTIHLSMGGVWKLVEYPENETFVIWTKLFGSVV